MHSNRRPMMRSSAGLVLALVSQCSCAAVWEWPRGIPSWYETHYFTQPVDHFNAQTTPTFRQRYLLNATYWRGPPDPILFYCGAESSVGDFFPHSGPVLDLARRLNALLIIGEMRFFGESLPFGVDGSFEHRPDRLGLLSVEPTIADDAALVEHIRHLRDAHTSPAIAIGGSLAGSLAFFLR